MIVKTIKAIYNTLYFNFTAFPFCQAIKFPAICGANVVFRNIERGKIIFVKGVRFKRMKLGLTKGSFAGGGKQRTYIHVGGKNARLLISDHLDIPCGSVLNVNGMVNIGKNFKPNYKLLISCENQINIGDNCNIGWNVTIIDGDGHPLCSTDNPQIEINPSKAVTIGNNCWLAAHVSIMKGVSLADNTTIPYGSIITKSCDQSKVIFGGVPNRILKENVVRQDYIIK